MEAIKTWSLFCYHFFSSSVSNMLVTKVLPSEITQKGERMKKMEQTIMEENSLTVVAVRLVSEPPLMSDTPIRCPQDVVKVMERYMSDFDREVFCVVNLQSDGRPISMNIVGIGALDGVQLNPREVVKTSILSNAGRIMLFHNHPSGNLSPSSEDIEFTERMVRVGELIGIPVLDHVILGRYGNYYSFLDAGIMPKGRREVLA